MRKFYNRETTSRDSSLINNYLGFSTDNGKLLLWFSTDALDYITSLKSLQL